MKYASFGSVSRGTMRTEDLLSTFADGIHKSDVVIVRQENGQ